MFALKFAASVNGAVSYTHLRAHETVLDLVCRLLLEKKKNNSMRTRIFTPSKQQRNVKTM